MATMQELRAEAKDAGVPVSEIRSAESAAELQGLIAGYASAKRTKVSAGGSKKVVAKKKTVAKKGAVAKKTTVKKSTTSKTTAKRGRPAGSKNKTTTAKARTTRSTGNGHVTTEGRHILGSINYSDTDGWNARPGSAPDEILKALRKSKGNRERAFEMLKGRVWEFVGKKLRDGSKRTLSSAHDMLKYRIARTDWDFALKTGQHTKSTKRVEYGTGGTGQGIFKRARKSARAAASKPAAKRGRPKGSTTKTTAKKPAAKRGRPAGSKNKTTTRKVGVRVTKPATRKRTTARKSR